MLACLLLPDGREALRRWSGAKTQPGADTRAGRLATLAREPHRTGRRSALAAPTLSWGHLAGLLRDTPLLAALGRAVSALSPKLVAGRKKADTEGGKTDRRAAFLMAARRRSGRRPAPFPVDVRSAPLPRLTRLRAHRAHTRARETNYFWRVLCLTFSALGTSEACGDPFGATSRAVVARFSSAEVIQMPWEDLAAFVQQQGRGRCADPDAGAATLTRAARAS